MNAREQVYVLTIERTWLEEIRLRLVSNTPHLLSDGAVYAVGGDQDVTSVFGSVFCRDSDVFFSVFHRFDTFVCQHSVVVLETIE